MKSRVASSSYSCRIATGMTVLTLVAVHCGLLYAGFRGFRSSSVGGISIDVEGVVAPAKDESKQELLNELRKDIKTPTGALAAPVAMRMVSLQALETACQVALKDNFGRLPDEVRFLGGLQRIQYVFLYPEVHDIVIAGPGEGWRVDDHANVVGVTTGRPVLQLDDLLVAFRTVEEARQGGITVSIDPTEEGTKRLNELLEKNRQTIGPAIEPAMKEAFGPQKVTVTGVPADSHFARVLVAADYRMKRLAMNLDPSPVKGLTSYVEMIKGAAPSAINQSTPRWWLACNYHPLATSADRLSWEIRGPGVKALTEDELVTTDGKRVQLEKASPTAQKWADALTEKYDRLSNEDAVFGDLRNIMDMCVLAALLQKEGLWEKAGLSVPMLTESSSALKTESWHAPKSVAPQVSFLKTRNSMIVTTSGGVAIESWQVADRKEPSETIAQLREKASSGNRKTLWW